MNEKPDPPEESPMISLSHWGMFVLPARRRESDMIRQQIIKYKKQPTLGYNA